MNMKIFADQDTIVRLPSDPKALEAYFKTLPSEVIEVVKNEFAIFRRSKAGIKHDTPGTDRNRMTLICALFGVTHNSDALKLSPKCFEHLCIQKPFCSKSLLSDVAVIGEHPTRFD